MIGAAVTGIALLILTNAALAQDEPELREQLRSYPHKLVIESRREGNWDLFLMNADGSGDVNLTRTPDVDELYPQASPDGSRICFLADEGQDSSRSRNLYLINRDGTKRTKIAENVRDPCWSPDGKEIAYLKGSLSRYTRVVYASRGLFLYDVGAGRHRDHPNRKIEHLYTVCWTPDGKWLMATVHGGLGFRHGIIAIEADGERVVDLKLRGCRPDVSPDGKRIAWGHGNYAIGVADLDYSSGVPRAKNVRNIVQSRKPMETYHVDWSPDGRFVAFSYGPRPRRKQLREGSPQHPGCRAEGWNTCVADATRKNRWVRLTADGKSNKEPDWIVTPQTSPDE